jgi:hypothetical protein
LDRLRFNILDIESNIAEDKNTPVYPETNPCSSIWFPVKYHLLILYHGNSYPVRWQENVQQIAYVLSQKYNGKVFKIEEDCIKFLNILEREGYIIF